MKVQRFSTNGKSQDKAGWRVEVQPGIVVVGDWRTGEKTTTKAEGVRYDPQAAKKAFIQQQADYAKAAQKAAFILAEGRLADHHWYIDRKGLDFVYPVLIDRTGRLVVPIYNANDDALMSLQFIDHDGGKMMMQGGRKKGGYNLPVGVLKGSQCIGIAEGYATALSVYRLFNVPCVCAFDAGNLPVVSNALRLRFPTTQIVIYADNDAAGLSAAKQTGLPVALPDDGFNDFSDVLMQQRDDEYSINEREAIKNESI